MRQKDKEKKLRMTAGGQAHAFTAVYHQGALIMLLSLNLTEKKLIDDFEQVLGDWFLKYEA